MDDPLIINKEFKSSFPIFEGIGLRSSYEIKGSINPYRSKYLDIKLS